jgi:hypothetical protein
VISISEARKRSGNAEEEEEEEEEEACKSLDPLTCPEAGRGGGHNTYNVNSRGRRGYKRRKKKSCRETDGKNSQLSWRERERERERKREKKRERERESSVKEFAVVRKAASAVILSTPSVCMPAYSSA